MRHLRRPLLALFSLLLGSILAQAQVSYTGGNYTQNFDTLTSATIATAANLGSPGPIALTEAPMNGSGLTGWSLARVSGTNANALFASGTGSSATGAVYSFGALNNSDRALGILQSGATNPTVGVVLTNNTGSTISQFTLSYTGEQWRFGGTTGTDKLAFEYQVGGSSILGGTYTPVPALDFTSVVNGTTGGVTGAQNGNSVKTAISSTVTGLSWASGQNLVLRWTDFNVTGSDDGLAIDDLTFSTSADPVVIAPSVVATIPADAAINVSPGSTVAVTFNAPATVSGAWYTISGSTSGAHPASVLGGPTTYTLAPTTPFAEGETVTVTVHSALVVDATTGTIPMAADYSFAFTTQTFSPLPIHTIQGSGATSPYVGQIVAVEGIVTADFQGTPGLGGFYLQAAEAGYDADPATSEGLFVFNTTFPVNVGDVVRVSGTVTEFGSAPSTQTELTSVTFVNLLGTGSPLPAAREVSLPFATTTSAETYEGMRVTLPQTLTVTDNFDLGHFGEVILSHGRLPTPTNIVAPGAPAIAQGVANFLNQIMLDDSISTSYPNPTPYLADSAGRGPTRRAGSTVTGVTGILDEKFGNYVIEPTAAVSFVDDNPRSDPPAAGGTLKVAIGNVLNFFNGDGSGGGFPTSRGADTLAEFQRQRAKIIAGITALAPDIMGLTEVENDRVTNGLAHSYGPLSAIADLVNGLNAAAPAGTTYAYVDASAVDIVSDQIMCAFIYRIETAAPVGPPAMLDHPSFNGYARNPLAQTFRQLSNGEKLTVCINHFKSKGSASSGAAATGGLVPNPNLDQGDGQGQSNYVRTLQANALTAWLATDPTGSGDPDFLIVGDLNAYAKEDPIVAIETAGYINLTEVFEGVGGYSYAFDGQFGHLDHALANDHLAEQVVSAATWHVNSDEPVYYDYNLENKVAAQQAVNATGAYRYSDHDPVVVGLALHPEYAAPAFTLHPQSQAIVLGQPVTFTATASGYPTPSLKWQKDGNDIPGATGGSYFLASVNMADAGTYAAVATNSQGSATSDPAGLTVLDITPPVLTLPANLVVEATGPTGATVTFSGSALDNVDGVLPVSFSPASGSVFPLGQTTVEGSATDAAGNTATDSFTVTVQDTTAPVITSLTATPSVLSPVNHQMVAVKITAIVSDTTDAAPVTRIIAVSSNQSADGKGDGHTAIDHEITGPMTVNLRAERSGNGGDRVYTITVETRDSLGNTATATVTVTVPHDQG